MLPRAGVCCILWDYIDGLGHKSQKPQPQPHRSGTRGERATCIGAPDDRQRTAYSNVLTVLHTAHASLHAARPTLAASTCDMKLGPWEKAEAQKPPCLGVEQCHGLGTGGQVARWPFVRCKGPAGPRWRSASRQPPAPPARPARLARHGISTHSGGDGPDTGPQKQVVSCAHM